MKSVLDKIFPKAARAGGIAVISFAALLFAACNLNAPQAGSARSAAKLVSAAPASAVSVSLGSASSFAVLGATTVTNAGVSAITGNLGVSPGTAITGFSSPPNTFSGPGTVTAGLGTVSGTIYAAGPVAAQAHFDAVVAYNALKAQVAPPAKTFAGVTTLDGLTFTPGVYSFAPAAILNAGATLTLDFGGNPNAVFVFQTGTTLTANALSQIVAINTGGASTPNVYWAVGSSATINGSQFIGTVIANIMISMTSGVNMAGAAIALTGSVTLIEDNIAAVPGAGSGSGGGGGNPPPVCKDFVTGGGWIDNGVDSRGHWGRYDNDKATFGVSGGIKNARFWGQLSFNDHNGTRAKSTSVTGYFVIDAATREIDGTATVNGQGSFTYKVIVSDNGQGGRHDTFSLALSNGYSLSGTLTGGNIQLHTDCGVIDGDHGRDHNGRENYKDNDEENGNSNCDR